MKALALWFVLIISCGAIALVAIPAGEHNHIPRAAEKSVVAVRAELGEADLFSLLFESKQTVGKPKPTPKPIEHITSGGTGFAVGNRIYTCEHVVHGATQVYVTLRDGRFQWARLLRSDKKTDLAELQVGDMPPPLQLRNRPPHFFEQVYQIGNPGDMRWVITVGHFITFDFEENRFLLDTYFGNSGSPIIDRSGKVIGMTHNIIRGTRYTGGGTLQDLRNFIFPDTPR